MNTIEVGKFIAELRKKKQLTQKELAEKLNVTDKAVSKWETGKCYPDIETLKRLSLIFEVSVNDILCGKIVENKVEQAEKNIVNVMSGFEKARKRWRVITAVLCIGVIAAFSLNTFFFGEKSREHQRLEKTEAYFDFEDTMRIDVPKIGLENVFVRQLEGNIKISADSFATVAILSDNRYEAYNHIPDNYLVVIADEKIVAIDLTSWEEQFSLGGEFECADVDGDCDAEFLVQENIGLSGGAGQYLSRVFDFKDGKLIEIFSSDTETGLYDTGFSIRILDGNKYEIKNKFTDYCEVFSFEEERINKGELALDSFYKFEHCDIENDGVYEIRCCQYASLLDHSDFVGTAVSVIKYDKEKSVFVVTDSCFEAGKFVG